MKYRAACVATAIGVFTGFVFSTVDAQQVAKRNFEQEIRTALESAKTAAGFEFFGTLTRICLLPQTGALDLPDNLPPYVANPGSVPPRELWYADPTKVFDDLYFVGGKLHSAWALTTSEGIILI